MKTDVKRDLQNLGNGLYAWVQGDGSWGWSNSGLIVGEDDQTLVVDTLSVSYTHLTLPTIYSV